MKTKVIASLFALAVVAQLWVPASMILSSEKALKEGKALKFQTAPVDPYDAFRGKYVTLEFSASTVDSANVASNPGLTYGNRAYAILGEDSNGFALVERLQSQRPKDGVFVPVEVRGVLNEAIRIQFPFTRFFLEEGKAKRAEELYRQNNRAGKQDSYAIVRVGSNGHAVIEDLVLGGLPVREALRAE